MEISTSALEWYEARQLTWEGKPLFTMEPPASTARPGQTGFSGETKLPNAAQTFSERTTGRGPSPPWSTMAEPDMETRRPKAATADEGLGPTLEHGETLNHREEPKRDRHTAGTLMIIGGYDPRLCKKW